MYGRSFSRKCAAIVIFFPYFVYRHIFSYLHAILQRWHNQPSGYEYLLAVTLKYIGFAPLHMKLG